MLEAAATALVLGSVLMLGWAAWIIGRFATQLPARRLHGEWAVLLGFIACFILGYLGYLGVLRPAHRSVTDLGVPGVFLLGAGFVLVVARLMHRTARDLSRISVLEAENITDALTGLYNRRDFDRRWNAELARARRFGLPLTLLMADIDHFKSVNDDFGHAAGDQVLVAIGRLICESLRASDLPARYGGEEFAIIAPHTGPQSALVLAERVRHTVEQRAHQALGKAAADRKVTISIGVAGCDNAAQGCERLFERADEALYAAKRGGRNRVVVAASVNVEGHATPPDPLAAGRS